MCAKVFTLYQMKVCYILRKNCTSNTDMASISKLILDNRYAVTVGTKKQHNLEKYDCFALTNLHKTHVSIGSDYILDDYIHMGAAQELTTKQFPHLGWLQNTVMQNCEMLKTLKGNSDNLQILHAKLGKQITGS